MINPRIYNIILDLKNKSYTSDIKVKQGDIDSNTFKIKLIQDSQAYNLTGLTTAAFFTRPDKAESFIDASITNAINGELEIKLTSQILNAEGYATCELKIIGTAGEVLSTLEFGFTILKSKDYTSVESSNEYNALVTALGKVGNLEAEYAPRLGSVESQLAKTVTEFQQVIANATVDSEVINARGGKVNLDARLDASDAQLNEKASKVQEALITPTLLNGHTQIDSSRRPRYRKNSMGQLVITGGFVSANNALDVFILDAEHRPDRIVNFPIFNTDMNPNRFCISIDGRCFFTIAKPGTFYLENITIELDGA